jgi:hypothetical protein
MVIPICLAPIIEHLAGATQTPRSLPFVAGAEQRLASWVNRYLTASNEEWPMSVAQQWSCIQACNACALACEHCAAACLEEPDVASMTACITLDRDCAEVCRLAAAWMTRNSERAGALCQLCAEVCEACAEECARHAPDHCQQCAHACQACADECRSMAA